MKIIVLASAEKDLDAGWRFYEDQAKGLGDDFIEAVIKGIRSLQTDYHLYPSKKGFHRMLEKKFHCGIYYSIQPDSVLVQRVLDLRRDPKWLRQQLKRSL